MAAHLEGEECLQVTAPHFSAGLLLRKGRVHEAAPILHYMKGWYLSEVTSYCAKKRWTLIRVDEMHPEQEE